MICFMFENQPLLQEHGNDLNALSGAKDVNTNNSICRILLNTKIDFVSLRHLQLFLSSFIQLEYLYFW